MNQSLLRRRNSEDMKIFGENGLNVLKTEINFGMTVCSYHVTYAF